MSFISSKSCMFLFALSVFVFDFSNAQDIENLNSKNGFRDIKLGSHISEYNQEVLLKKNDTLLKYFGWKTNYDYIMNLNKVKGFDSIASGEIKSILINVVDDLISEIDITVTKDYEIFKILKYNFGEPNKYNSLKHDNAIWEMDDIELSFTGRDDRMAYYIINFKNKKLWSKRLKLINSMAKKKALSEF